MKLLAYLSLLALGLTSCLPASTPYPFEPPSSVVTRAEVISDSLESYILKWTQGAASPMVPDSLIPDGISDSKDFYLKHPDSATSEETWAVRLAKAIDKDSLRAGIPDPKVTYLFLGTALAPFGSKLVIEGEFPHCRFFSIQTSPPLNGKEYYAQRQFGTAEVSFVDADIEPLPGHTNPFRIGANRTATDRSYRVEVDLATGDPVSLNNQAHQYPYRENSNQRTGAMMVYQGPLGYKTIVGTDLAPEQQGDWNLGALWIRIYEPDDNVDALGGVPMPKAWFELPNGAKYFIGSDFSNLQERADETIPNRVTPPGNAAGQGPADGWHKSWGITRSMLNGVSLSLGYNRTDSAARVQEIDLGWTGRGEFQSAPGNIEPHATTNNYSSYIGRGMTVAPGMVCVLTGKMPTFPSTRNGEATMEAGQIRYWSMIGLDQDPLSPLPSTAVHAISDDDVLLDSNRNFVIAYSRVADRPTNATSPNGVTWVDYGEQSDLGLLMRWVNVKPEWSFPLDPHEGNLDFAHSDWAGSQYDSTLIGVNWRNGFMKCFMPKVHYMTVAQFEALSGFIQAEDVPVWVDSSYAKVGAAESQLGTAYASSSLDTSSSNAPYNMNDGDLSTAWSSAFGQPTATATIDLGAIKTISAIKLNWDWVFFAKDYTIETSNDDIVYTPILGQTAGNGAVDLFDHLQGVKARFVRLNLSNFNTAFYRLVEFEVFTNDCNCTANLVSRTPVEAPNEISMQLYPNPANERVHLRFDVQGNALVDIYDMNGKHWRSAKSRTGTATIELDQIPAGTYIAMVNGNGRKTFRKFVKLR